MTVVDRLPTAVYIPPNADTHEGLQKTEVVMMARPTADLPPSHGHVDSLGRRV